MLMMGELNLILGYLNGNGDKDGFKIHNRGTYIFRTVITGGVDVDANAVTGMALRVTRNNGSGQDWFDVHLRWDDRDAEENLADLHRRRVQVAVERGADQSRQVSAGLQPQHLIPRVPYTMYIERERLAPRNETTEPISNHAQQF